MEVNKVAALTQYLIINFTAAWFMWVKLHFKYLYIKCLVTPLYAYKEEFGYMIDFSTCCFEGQKHLRQ